MFNFYEDYYFLTFEIQTIYLTAQMLQCMLLMAGLEIDFIINMIVLKLTITKLMSRKEGMERIGDE